MAAAYIFFIYDIIKITILLCTLIFVISYIQSYFPPERSKRILGRFHGLGARIAAALLGTVTPFCSCSSIPLFMGFTGAGLPLGVTFSFLISSPMVDLGSLVLLTSIFGVKIAAVYVLLGLFVAVLGGTLIEKLHMETQVEEFIRMAGRVDLEGPALTVRDRLVYAREQVESTFRKVFPYILAGVGIGAVIHNWIPEAGSRRPWEAGIPLESFWPFWWASPCTRIFSGPSRWRRHFWPREPAGNHLKLHDGSHHLEPPVMSHAGKGGEAAAFGNVCGNLYRRYHLCGIYF